MVAETVRTPAEVAAGEISKFNGIATKDGEPIKSAAPADNMTDGEKKREADEVTAGKQAAAAVKGKNLAEGEPEEGTQGKTPAQIAADAIAAARGDAPVAPTEGAEDGADLEEAAPAEDTPSASKTPRSAQERINQAVAKQRQAEREAAHWRDVATRGTPAPSAAPVTAPAAGEKPLPAGLEPMPKPEGYTYQDLDAKYGADLAAWNVKKTILEDRASRQQEDQRRTFVAEQDRVRVRVKEISDGAIDKYPDFNQVVVEGAAKGEYPVSIELGELILGSPHGADIAYALATDVPEAVRVSRLSPLAQAAYFGRLENQFAAAQSAQTTKSVVQPSKAPMPPARQARGQGGNTAPVTAATQDFAAFERMAAAKRK